MLLYLYIYNCHLCHVQQLFHSSQQPIESMERHNWGSLEQIQPNSREINVTNEKKKMVTDTKVLGR